MTRPNTVAKNNKQIPLAQILERELRAGSHRVGEQFFTQKAIMERFEIASRTAGGIIGILASKRLVETRKGEGTFVLWNGGKE